VKQSTVILLAALVLLALWASVTWAGDVTVSIVPAVNYENGQIIPENLKAPFSVEWGTCNGTGFGTRLGEVFATSPDVLGFKDPDLADGDFCFRAFTNLTNGLRSRPSNVVMKSFAPINNGLPMPPTIITVMTVAYELRGHRERSFLVAVGTVGIGTQCLRPWEQNPEFARVRVRDVTFDRPYRGGRVYGVCELQAEA